jgi:tRNA U34 5-methylaminomethyl-2-thiouridine-forming methyltransferase MnmC
MVAPPQLRMLDASNRLCILLDAFLIEVFPLCGVVFARSYCGGLLLGVVLVDARECKPPSLDVCLPCDACILGGFSRCFLGFFWLVFVFLGRVQQELLEGPT